MNLFLSRITTSYVTDVCHFTVFLGVFISALQMGSDLCLWHHHSSLRYSSGFCSSEGSVQSYRAWLFSGRNAYFSHTERSFSLESWHPCTLLLLVSSGHIKNASFTYLYLLPLFCWDSILACIAGCTQTYMILLSQPFGYRNCKHAPPCPSGFLISVWSLYSIPYLFPGSWYNVLLSTVDCSADAFPPSILPCLSYYLFFNSWVGV